MRERAQATWPWLLQLLTTLSEFPDKLADSLQWECFIKVGIRTGSRLAFTTEHLWFRMLEHTEHQITAVLISEPEGASRLRSGAIATYGAADISGWMVRTRLGTIMPHDDRVARMLFELSATR